MKRGENGNVKEGSEISGGKKSEDCLSSCMEMTWFCVLSRRKSYGQWWDVLLRCVDEG